MRPGSEPRPVDDASLQAYYARGEEENRLDRGVGRLEFVRTLELIGRVLPDPPAVIADIGGGPGAYTDRLLELGYDVVHRDVVADHVANVRARHGPDTSTGERLDAAVCDARQLDLPDASADAALLLGPLYHLPDRADRGAALAEAARIVAPGGPMVVAAISRHAILLHGILLGRIDREYPEVFDVLDGVRETGVLPPLHEGSFNGYAHRADEFRAELIAAGLTVDALVSVEGIGMALGDLDERLDDRAERDRLMFVLRSVEGAPDVVGLGPHLLALTRVPG